MLLKCTRNKLAFIDATSNEGVSVCNWSEFTNKGYYKCYDKIVYRPLEFNRNYENQSALEKFIKKVVGKKYKLNPLKMIQKYSNLDSVINISEGKSYFCSELIGSILKSLGLLPENISSAQYWPGSFSAETKMILKNGAVFGDEYLIEFN